MSEEEQIPLPEVSPQELAGWMQSQPEIFLLDVRERYEFRRAHLEDERVLRAPLSELARQSTAALPDKLKANPEKTVVVFCHHGIRSAQVTAWLLDLGWKSVYNLAGGIDAYARQVDASIGLY